MASGRKDITFMFNALEGFGLFSMKEPVIPDEASNEVVNQITHQVLCDLDQYIQESEKKLLALILERGASKIKIADDASDEHKNKLSLLIDNLMPEKVLPLFLQAVAFGEKNKVEAMIKLNPDLLTLEGYTKDQAGRTLKGTALRLALGAKDVSIGKHEEMVEMIERYMREKLVNGEDEIKNQKAAQFPAGWEEVENARKMADLEALEKVFKDIDTSTTDEQGEAAVAEFKAHLAKEKERVIETGYHFNDDLFEKAQELYNVHFDQFGGFDSRKNRLSAIKVIGGMQCYFTHFLAQAARDGFSQVYDCRS